MSFNTLHCTESIGLLRKINLSVSSKYRRDVTVSLGYDAITAPDAPFAELMAKSSPFIIVEFPGATVARSGGKESQRQSLH